MNKILKKQFFKVEFQLASPLAVGSGENHVTDKDILVDGRGVPYIPGSSIAGVCSELLGKDDSNREIWGDVLATNSSNADTEALESHLVFYDAQLVLKNREAGRKTTSSLKYVTIRDHVSLDDYKTAIQGAKFDMQALEPSDSFFFVTYLEQSFYIDNEEAIAKRAADLFRSENLRFGSKTMRGYGKIKNVKIQALEFLFDSSASADSSISLQKGIDDWADFSLFDCRKWGEYKASDYEKGYITIHLGLKQEGGISIRRYTTDVSVDGPQPDSEQLTLTDGDAVIPGSSWAGAFQHQMRKILGLSKKNAAYDEFWRDWFGYVDGNGDKARSKVRFSESIIPVRKASIMEGAVPKVLSRNAIDRFTGGTVDGALFTEKTYFNGTTDLWIEIDRKAKEANHLSKALAAAIADLHYGFMAVGGETSIGRGLFSITSINGKTIDAISKMEYEHDPVYDTVLSIISMGGKV